jgi:hypothetical protein
MHCMQPIPQAPNLLDTHFYLLQHTAVIIQSRNELGGGGRRIKLNKCLQPVPLSYSPDSTIRFGDTMLLESCETGGALACDPFEEVPSFPLIYNSYFPLFFNSL